MIRSHCIRRRTAPRLLIPGALLAAIAVPALIAHAGAATGHWSPKSVWSQDDPERYAVHMMLLRGDNDPYHSRILWWQGEAQIYPSTETIFYGGEWGWTPGDDDCSTYPTAHFVPIGVDTSGMDPFCGSHMMLGDGRVLMAGGHNPFITDYGDNRVRIFKDSTGTRRGAWSVAHDMNYWRWYPTATALRDSRAVLVSGNQYRQHQVFGGKRGGSPPATPTGDSLYRFAPIPGGQWDPSILPDPASGNLRPTPRYAHSAIAADHVNPFNAQVYFGGHDATGLVNDTWFQRIDHSDQLRRDPRYVWEKPTIATPNGSPAARSDHSAIVALDTCMVVFGGLDATDSGRNDAWRLFYDSSLQPPGFSWSPITPTDTIPPARFGHGAIYDTTIRSGAAGDTLRRMIVFGGTSAPNQAPTDSRVWELRFSSSNPTSATWHEMPQDTLGSDGGPSPRYWHTMNVDRNDRVLGTRGTCHVAFMFGGTLDTGACSDTLWKLWIFKNGHVGWEKVLPASSTVPGARARHSAILDTHQSGYGGRLYVFGGVTANGQPADARVNVLDPWGGKYATWAQGSDLGTSLAGQTALLDDEQQYARTAEVYDPGTDLWTALSFATMRQQSYPPVFLVPGGSNGASRMISINNNSLKTYALDIPASGQSGAWQPLAMGDLDLLPQAGVLYRPDRLMVAGGQDVSPRIATGKTRTLDAASLGNRWVQSGDMVARLNANLVLLPTGNVLAVGGNQTGVSGSPIKRPQMWSLVTDSTGVWNSATDPESWLEEQPTIRPHHSTAILLPDGRVLSAGGDGDQDDPDSDQHTGDIFCPPYLFNPAGTALVARPTFSNSAKPESLGFGKVFTICVPDTAGITRACLIRPGATTHAFDQNQRYVPLSFTTAGSPMRLLVTSPASPDSAPPGDYMLFLTGKEGYQDVPSIARWVRVGAAGLDSCDTVMPTAADLSAECDPNVTNGWTISWQAPADDGVLGASGPAASFDMRQRTSSITSSNWRGAAHVNTPIPGTVGTSHSVSLGASGTRYLRMASRDDNNNPAADSTHLSNQVVIFPWTSQGYDCAGGDGMYGGGGGGGGARAGRAPGLAGVQPAAEPALAENTLLPGARAGEKARDAWRLAAGVTGARTSYTARIRERTGRAAALDRVRLIAVDHAADLSAYSLGDGFVLGHRASAVRVTAGDGTELGATLDGGGAYVAVPGETLSVDLGAGGGASPLVIEAGGPWPSALEALVSDGTGGWRSLGRLHPRRTADELTLAAPGSETLRLAVIGSVSLEFVGRLAVAADAPTVRGASLLAAEGSRLGDVNTVVSASDNVSATLVGPDTLGLSFEAPPLAEGQVRDLFLVVEATQVTPRTLARMVPVGESEALPTRFALRQNQPNPFTATTTIRFDLPIGAMVRLEIFDVQGRRVKVVTNHYSPAGYQAVQWDRRDEGGGTARPGVYLYRLTAGAFRAQKKMVVLP